MSAKTFDSLYKLLCNTFAETPTYLPSPPNTHTHTQKHARPRERVYFATHLWEKKEILLSNAVYENYYRRIRCIW